MAKEKMLLVRNDEFTELDKYLNTHDWYIKDYKTVASSTGAVYVYVHLCSRISVRSDEWEV